MAAPAPVRIIYLMVMLASREGSWNRQTNPATSVPLGGWLRLTLHDQRPQLQPNKLFDSRDPF